MCCSVFAVLLEKYELREMSVCVAVCAAVCAAVRVALYVTVCVVVLLEKMMSER